MFSISCFFVTRFYQIMTYIIKWSRIHGALNIFAYYVHSVRYSTFKYPANAYKALQSSNRSVMQFSLFSTIVCRFTSIFSIPLS